MILERVERYLPLTDISVRSDGDGRTVDAYAAAFDVEQEIRDVEGHYMESIDRNAFDLTLQQQRGRLQVMYNHGKTMYGTPSEKFSMPLGTIVEIKPDGNGLFTRTHYSNTPLGDEVLQLIKDGAIRGQSFSGAFLKTKNVRAERGGLPHKIRTEIAMREFGPTPFPAYHDAHMIGVRTQVNDFLRSLDADEMAEYLHNLAPAERAAIVEALNKIDGDTSATTDAPTDDSTTSATAAPVDAPRPDDVQKYVQKLKDLDKWTA